MRTSTLTPLCLAALLAACADPSSNDEGAGDGGVLMIDPADPEPDGEPEPEAQPEPEAEPEPEPGPDAAPEPEPDAAPPARGDAGPGEACEQDLDCAEGVCLPDPGFPGGYCAEIDCSLDAPCGLDTTCVPAGQPICAVNCEAAPCREGYTCVDFEGEGVCLPGADGDRLDGMACERDEQCAGGACIEDWPGGYCTTVGCADRTDCARGPEAGTDNRCFVSNDPTFCVRMCQAPGDCRPGYLCQPVGQGLGVCFPDPNEPVAPPEGLEDSPLGITCEAPVQNGVYALDYEVQPDTSGYMIVPFAIDGQRISPVRVERPSGGQIDFRGQNNFQTAGAALFGSINPTVVPATSRFEGQLEAGNHRYVLASNASQMCWYQVEEQRDGTEIDLNIYLVDIGFSAAQAPGNANMQAVLDAFEGIYQSAGVSIGEVRFFDIGGQDAANFGVIRSQEAVGQVLTRTRAPGDTLDDALSLNIVFIQTFALPGGGGVLGISQGLPGPAGLHGTQASGVVFTSEFLGGRFRDGSGQVVDGNNYTGIVMAHEAGHYLGLFHTTEQNQRSTDPIQDTPACTGGQNFPTGCPDWTNLMFPLAGPDHTVVTDEQQSVIRANPLTKE